MAHAAEAFEALFTADADPWKFKTRWYEARKRALTLACLPQARYGNAYEPGCANGELSAALAERCDRLIVSDGAPKAVQLARERLANLGHVEVREMWVPTQWPSETFDLIVISELGYFLSAPDMADLALRARDSLAPGGTLLACHWRRPPENCELDGNDAHVFLEEAFDASPITRYIDDDMRIDVWCKDRRSVAQREGFAP